MEPKKPRRRWLRISLGGLLLAITVLCLLLGWQADRVARQRRAVEMVERLGGYVAYDDQWVESPPFSYYSRSVESPTPRWLQNLLGEDWFRTVACVALEGGVAADRVTALVPKPLTNADWQLLSELDGLKVLSVTHQPTTDQQVRYLARLTQLEELTLDGAEISDEGLCQIARLTNLRELTIGNDSVETAPEPGVTDRGLGYLASLTKLTSLGLGATHATETGLEQLRHLQQLESVTIGFPHGTQVHLAWLRHWPNLTTLMIRSVRVTEAGWDALAASRQLENLWFTDCVVSSEGLRELRGLNLEFLGLTQTPIAGNALEGLTKLTAVHLNAMNVSGEVLHPLVDARELHALDLSQSKISDEDLARLPALHKLRFLTLSGTSIGDAGLAGVNNQPDLRYLRLNGTEVTDAGLASLKISTLVSVDVRDTNVTEAAAEQFRQATRAAVITDAGDGNP